MKGGTKDALLLDKSRCTTKVKFQHFLLLLNFFFSFPFFFSGAGELLLTNKHMTMKHE